MRNSYEVNRAAEFQAKFEAELRSHDPVVRNCLIAVLAAYDKYLEVMTTKEREFCARFLKEHLEEAHRLSEMELKKEMQ